MNRRMMYDSNPEDGSEGIMSTLQRSLIAETLQGARAHVGVPGGKASLNEPSRPYTPGDMPRHLIYGNDYSNRPGSSYKMNNVIDAAYEFESTVASNTNKSGVKTQANTNSDSKMSEDVLSIIERHQTNPVGPIGGRVQPKIMSTSITGLR